MKEESVNKLYELLESIPVTSKNRKKIEKIRETLSNKNYIDALNLMKELSLEEAQNKKNFKDKDQKGKNKIKESENVQENSKQNELEENKDISDETDEEDYENEEHIDEKNDEDEEIYEDEENNEDEIYENEEHIIQPIQENENLQKLFPDQLSDEELEQIYMGLLLSNPQYIVKYYFLHEDCYFEDEEILNIYKSVLYTEGEIYAPEIAKKGFNFSRDSDEVYAMKQKLKQEVEDEDYEMEDIYLELKKLFVLRKNYLKIPIKDIQEKIVEIINYKLYDDMTAEEVEDAVNQVTATGKFKQAILSSNLTEFLEKGDNNLTNGLALPFPILTSVFKGIRRGETMAFAMPSNCGKSRFTIDLAAYTAFVHQKKVLIISNEMSEEKMKLCLITTILNNPEIQKLHGQKISKTEGELLEFKFRPDNVKNVKVDENGFILQNESETRKDFIQRLIKVSSEFNNVIKATDWINKEISNSICFVNITDHTNDELKKVIMNYYYKEKVEYVFYDTLKTDTANIGNGEEIKRTATILSNLAQNFNMFICSTLQLSETNTLPIDLNVNDLAVSRTVKEVLDTLCLIKQINRENYSEYEYSLNEVDTKFFELKKYDDPDVRYYTCVVDKNRAGAKPRLVFRLNLAYNIWEELGYIRFKQ